MTENNLNEVNQTILNSTESSRTETVITPVENSVKKDSQNKSLLAVVIVIILLVFIWTTYNGFLKTSLGNQFSSYFNVPTIGLSTDSKYSSQRDSILNILNENYIGDFPSKDKMDQGQLQGLVQSVGDKYTSYLTCEEYQKFQDDLNQNFEGIGARFQQLDDYIQVADLVEGSPAKAAGLQKDDVLVSVNGENVDDLSFSQIISGIRGKAGTSVKLEIDRPIDKNAKPITYSRLELNIERQQIHQDALELQIKDNIAWLKISTFSRELDTQMNQAAEQIKQNSKIEYIVVDLRDNGGGLLDQAVQLSSYFLPTNTVVVKEKGKTNQRDIRSTYKTNNLSNYPLLVVVNQDTASASEITAGALQDNQKAKVMGKKTYGKGVVQEINDLPGGCDKLKVTIAEWLTPNNRAINNKGIAPDIKVPRGVDYVDKAKEYFNSLNS